MSEKYKFHHLGIPTNEARPNEHYSEHFKMYTSDREGGQFRIQYHRFSEGCPLHPIIQNHPHIALQVADLAEVIQGKEILLGPYEPIPGYKVAIINDNGIPFELIETELTDEELWGKARQQTDLNVDQLTRQ